MGVSAGNIDYSEGGWVYKKNSWGDDNFTEQYKYIDDQAVLANAEDIIFDSSKEEARIIIQNKIDYHQDNRISYVSSEQNYWSNDFQLRDSYVATRELDISEYIELVKRYGELYLDEDFRRKIASEYRFSDYSKKPLLQELWNNGIHIDPSDSHLTVESKKSKNQRSYHKHSKGTAKLTSSKQVTSNEIHNVLYSLRPRATNVSLHSNCGLAQECRIGRSYNYGKNRFMLINCGSEVLFSVDLFNAINGKNAHRCIDNMQILFQKWKTSSNTTKKKIDPLLGVWLDQEVQAQKRPVKKFINKPLNKRSVAAQAMLLYKKNKKGDK